SLSRLERRDAGRLGEGRALPRAIEADDEQPDVLEEHADSCRVLAAGERANRGGPPARQSVARASRCKRREGFVSHTSLPLTRNLRLRRTGSRLAQRGSTARLVPRALSLPRRAPPPLWETTRAATRTVSRSAS